MGNVIFESEDADGDRLEVSTIDDLPTPHLAFKASTGDDYTTSYASRASVEQLRDALSAWLGDAPTRADRYNVTYARELAMLARVCTGAALEDIGGGAYALCGTLENGLDLQVGNGDLDGVGDNSPFYIAGYADGEQVVTFENGTLEDMLETLSRS